MRKLIFIVVLSFSAVVSSQRFDLSAEVRPRYENRHGFSTLIDEDTDGTNFVSQRTRLNFDYKQEKIRLRVIFQNIRVWGDVGTMASDDKATALHEAWAEAVLSDKISFKLGRQEIVYDDHRIFGNVDWAQQARSHDAFLFKFTPDKNNRLDVGLALNSDREGITDELYSNAAGYKAFQYAWYHGNYNKFGVSFLLLNTGIEYLDDSGTDEKQVIDYMQTIGSRLTYKSGKFSGNVATYFQTGKSLDAVVRASYFAGNIDYKVMKRFTLGVGMEYLSGKDMDESNSDVRSFAPLFGTNHKFNGWMDYFYVGNHAGSVGLTDIYATLAYKKDKFSAKLVPHLFSAAADVYNGSVKMDNNLGTEIDFIVGYKLDKNISVNAGYSKMFATETMEVLKGGDKDENNSWGWVMVTFKPQLFSYTSSEE